MTELKLVVPGTHNPLATPDANGQYPVDILRGRLSAEVVYSSDYRYNDALDQFQFYRVSDGAWVDAASVDPRKATAFPPLTGSNIQCDSAHSFRWWFEHRYIALLVELLNAGSTLAFIASQIVAAIAAITKINYAYFISLALDIATAAFAQGAAAVTAAMSTANLNTLERLIYCRMNVSGQLDAASFSLLMADILAAFSGDAESIIVLALTLGQWGEVNALAAQGFDRGHCVGGYACTWTKTFDFTLSSGFWRKNGAAYYTNCAWVNGGWQSGVSVAPATNQVMFITTDVLPVRASQLVSVRVKGNNTLATTLNRFYWMAGFVNLPLPAGAYDVTIAMTPAIAASDFFYVQNEKNGTTGKQTVNLVKLSGTGVCPFAECD